MGGVGKAERIVHGLGTSMLMVHWDGILREVATRDGQQTVAHDATPKGGI